MPPIRLPQKTKGKQLHIDYTSIDTAVVAPLDFDGWLEEGVAQQNQGDRYANSAGSKAQRHYVNARRAFECAARTNGTSFDAVYNAATVTQQLASDHLGPPQCIPTLDEAIALFGRSLELAQTDDERIDSLFNRAQACVTRHEMDEDALRTGKNASPDSQMLLEARKLFVQVEGLQRTAVEKVFGTDVSEAMEQDRDETLAVTDTNTVGTDQAVETRTVTPRQVIDTILESLQVDLSLYAACPATDTASLQQLVSSAVDAIERMTTLRQSLARADTTLDLELELVRLSFADTCTPDLPPESPFALSKETIAERFASLTQTHPSNLELLSAAADFFVNLATHTGTSSDASITHLNRSLSLYTQAQTLLSSRLRPPPGIPAFLIPSLLAQNLVSQSQVHLMMNRLSSEPKSVERALKAALDAIAATQAGHARVTRAGATGPVSLVVTPLLPNQTKDLRQDWRSFKALRVAYFGAWRAAMFATSVLTTAARPGPPLNAMLKGWQDVIGPTLASSRSAIDDFEFVVREEWKDDAAWTEDEARAWEQALQQVL